MTDLSKMTPWRAYLYARYVKEAPWPEMEPIIMTDSLAAYHYARDVKQAPWPEAEPIIKESKYWDGYKKYFNIEENTMPDLSGMTPYEAYVYTLEVKKAPWPEGEPIIMTDAFAAYLYARDVKQAPWPEAEPVIMKDPEAAYWYALEVKKAPWPEAEAVIMTDPLEAYCYSIYVKKAPWPEAEAVIKDSKHWNKYKNHFNIKEKEMNNLIKATITLNDGTESIIEFSSSLEAEQWRMQIGYNPMFLCINFEKATYVKTRDIQSVVFNKSLIEMVNLAKEESLQRERAYNSPLSQAVGNQLASPISRF